MKSLDGTAANPTANPIAGALEPLVAMLDLHHSLECNRWAAFALAALSHGHAANRVAIAEAGGIGPLVLLLGSSMGASAALHHAHSITAKGIVQIVQ